MPETRAGTALIASTFTDGVGHDALTPALLQPGFSTVEHHSLPRYLVLQSSAPRNSSSSFLPTALGSHDPFPPYPTLPCLTLPIKNSAAAELVISRPSFRIPSANENQVTFFLHQVIDQLSVRWPALVHRIKIEHHEAKSPWTRGTL